MKAEIVNAFLSAARHNLAKELQSEIKRVGLRVEMSAHVTDEVVIYLSFVGQVRGSLLLGLNLATARTIAATMVNEPLEELTEMGLSALAELGNLVAGGACTELEKIGLSADITPPTIMIGPQTRISTLGVSRIVVPMACRHGSLNLHLSIDVAA